MHSVDPGVDYYALAEWDYTRLAAVGVYAIDHRYPHQPGQLYEIAIESQEIRPGARARAKDIIALAQSAGRVADRYEKATWYHYYEWAGQTPEKTLHKKVLARLTDRERALILALKKKDQGHVIEAVGIGLYHLRRIGCSR